MFVGDTYTYFAGMTIAVAGILGHFSETLLLLLIPQVSIPNVLTCAYCANFRMHPAAFGSLDVTWGCYHCAAIST